MDSEGQIRKKDESFIVEAPFDKYVASLPGVETSEDGLVNSKVFSKKRIYLPHELDRAIVENLEGHDVLRLAANGYSNLTAEHCMVWGVKPGAYEQAVASLLEVVTSRMQDLFKGVDVRYLHGASNMGVDAAIMQASRRLNRPNLGFSCPRFMFYVEDDFLPVYVANSQAAYADAFARSTDILIAANGRAQALQHDLMAALMYGKEVVLVNVLRTISTNGGPPAIGPEGKIEDAVDAFLIRVHAVGQRLERGNNRDHWRATVEEITEVASSICRQKMSPARAFML